MRRDSPSPVTWALVAFDDFEWADLFSPRHSPARCATKYPPINLVCDRATLVVAWEQVASNPGARTAGVEGDRVENRMRGNVHVRFGGWRWNGSTQHLPLERVATSFLFQLVSKRYTKGSIIVTSNKSYAEWGSVFGDEVATRPSSTAFSTTPRR
jgi:IstB-like ATP binding protein